MITLTATIELLGADKGTLKEISTNSLPNNISSRFSALLGARKQGSNPFIIGASKLGDGSTFSDKVDYFIGSQLSDSEGNFATPHEIFVDGINISALTIAFDKENGRHPNTINIDGTDYYDDDAIFTITDLPSANTHKITISNWNSPNYPLVITGIYIQITINLNNRNMLSIESNIKSRSDMKFPSFGIISNGGSIEFNDYDGEVADYAERQLLQGGTNVYVYLNDTLTKNTQRIGQFKTDKWNYDNNNRSVSVTIKDDLEQIQDVLTNGFSYSKSMTMLEIYNWLVQNTPQFYFEPLSDKIKDYLNSIVCKYAYLDMGSIWAQWTKFCETCGLTMYINNNKIKFIGDFLE